MRTYVGMALLFAAVAAGGALLIVLPDRAKPPPSVEPFVVPEIRPDLEPVGVPPQPAADLPEPLKPIPREVTIPAASPTSVEEPTPPPIQAVAAPPEESLPTEPAPPSPDHFPEETPVSPTAPEPPTPHADAPEESSTLVTGRDAPPLPGPVDDPSQLLTREELAEAEPPAPGEVRPVQDTLLAVLNNTMRVMTADGRIQLKLTGRLYVDAALMNADQELEDLVGDFNSDAEVRTARLGVLGVVKFAEFRVDYDFAGGDSLVGEPDLRDLWVGVKDIPVVGRLRIGRMKEPLGLEQWMSGNARTFMESGLPRALVIGRNPGLLAFDTALSGRLFWWAGLFGYTADGDQFGQLGTNFSARVCGTPWFEEGGKRLLHVGMSGSIRPSHPRDMSISSRPEAHLAPTIVGTPSYVADRQYVLGLEAALLDGPYSLQGEIQGYSVETANQGRSFFWGAYLYGSIVLTGEHRVYRNGQFTRPLPKRVAFDGGLGGAWEVAARVSHLDLKSGELNGGVVTNLTLGVNWYTSDHSRFMANYIHSHRWDVGSANILQFRFQMDF